MPHLWQTQRNCPSHRTVYVATAMVGRPQHLVTCRAFQSATVPTSLATHDGPPQPPSYTWSLQMRPRLDDPASSHGQGLAAPSPRGPEEQGAKTGQEELPEGPGSSEKGLGGRSRWCYGLRGQRLQFSVSATRGRTAPRHSDGHTPTPSTDTGAWAHPP